mmetsp:Transcript_24151/g.35410  ORF Transcript_24151/g.35410 Transcript_24151/m.35410 type:complete len:256 (-) Transcript_24151:280-1047(-)
MGRLCFASVFHCLEHGDSEISRGPRNVNTGIIQCSKLSGCRALSARDNGTSMPHSTTRRSCGSCNESNNRFAGITVFLQPFGCVLLSTSTDLPNHDDTFSLRVMCESLQTVYEIGSIERITSDADASTLSETNLGSLGDCFISEGTGPAHDSDFSLLMDITRHNTNLAFFRLDNSRTVGADQSTSSLLVQVPLHLDHVLLGNSLGNTNNKCYFVLNSINNSIRCKLGRHIYDSGIRLDSINGLSDSVKHWKAKMS